MKKKIEFERYFTGDYRKRLNDLGLSGEWDNFWFCVPIVHKQGEEPVYEFCIHVKITYEEGTQIIPRLKRTDGTGLVDIGKRHVVETGDIESVRYCMSEEFEKSRLLFDPSFDWRGEFSKKYDWVSKIPTEEEKEEKEREQEKQRKNLLAKIFCRNKDEDAVSEFLSDDDSDDGTDAVSDFIGSQDSEE